MCIAISKLQGVFKALHFISIQFHHNATMVKSGLLEVPLTGRAGWRFASTMTGIPSVMMDGTHQMLVWPADSWAIQGTVSYTSENVNSEPTSINICVPTCRCSYL